MAKRLISSCILFFIVSFFCGCGAPKKLISLVDIAEVKMVKVGDINIAYKTFEHGEPLILIMGYTGTMDDWDGVCDRLPTITQPTLLMTGTDDILTPPQNSLNMAQKIPGAWLVQIEGGGHGMMFQYPNKFTEAVLVFLRDLN